MGSAGVEGRVPLILIFSKRRYADEPAEKSHCGLRGVIERDAHCVGILLILVDDEQRPLTVRPLHSVRSYQNMPGSITDVACCAEQFVHAVTRLNPFEVDKLAGKILRE